MATSELTARPATRPAAVLDDADSRHGSATSLLRTIVGCYLRRLGGWIAAEALIELMTTVGVNQARTRTAILRVRGKGLLAPKVREGDVGYALSLHFAERRTYSQSARQAMVLQAAAEMKNSFGLGKKDTNTSAISLPGARCADWIRPA